MDGLSRIRQAAQNARACVFMFVVSSEGFEKTNLNYYCDEYVEILPCEPIPDAFLAFSAEMVSLRYMNFMGTSKKMVCLKIGKEKIAHNYSQFVSSEHNARMMWWLFQEGVSMSEIAIHFGINKSNISRRLQNLPHWKPEKQAPGWVTRYRESLSVVDDAPPAKKRTGRDKN